MPENSAAVQRPLPTATASSAGSAKVAWPPALAAAAGNDRAAADKHFEAAIRQADQLPYHTEQAETRRWYEWALERFGRSSDHRRISDLREAAAAKYRELGATSRSFAEGEAGLTLS